MSECTCKTSIRVRLKAIEEEVRKLRQAIMGGLYDTRSIVGDAVLRIEGQLKQLREIVPPLAAEMQEPARKNERPLRGPKR